MAGNVLRTPRARLDLIEIWQFVADDSERSADRLLDRIDEALNMLAENPRAGRARPELASDLRSFSVGANVLFYRPLDSGVELVRVRGGYMDIHPEDMA